MDSFDLKFKTDMKKIILTSAFFSLLIFLSSCLTTIHPIFTEKDIVFKEELIGNWSLKEDKLRITPLAKEKGIELPGKIATIKDKGYLLDIDGDRSIGFLARIGNHLYFDFYPLLSEVQQDFDEFFMAHLIRRHSVYRVNLKNKDSFELTMLDAEFLENLIKQNKFRIKHETDSEGSIIITASTEELQQYIIKYGDEPGAYLSESQIYTKVNPNL